MTQNSVVSLGLHAPPCTRNCNASNFIFLKGPLILPISNNAIYYSLIDRVVTKCILLHSVKNSLGYLLTYLEASWIYDSQKICTNLARMRLICQRYHRFGFKNAFLMINSKKCLISFEIS